MIEYDDIESDNSLSTCSDQIRYCHETQQVTDENQVISDRRDVKTKN